jgi:hypothetical protein
MPVCGRHIFVYFVYFVYFVVVVLAIAGRTAFTCDGCCSTKYMAVCMKCRIRTGAADRMADSFSHQP